MISPTGPATESFTTGQAARILRVSPRTVSKWMDTGLLVGYLMPGSDHRRFTRGELVAFIGRHNLPITVPELDSPPTGEIAR